MHCPFWGCFVNVCLCHQWDALAQTLVTVRKGLSDGSGLCLCCILCKLKGSNLQNQYHCAPRKQGLEVWNDSSSCWEHNVFWKDDLCVRKAFGEGLLLICYQGLWCFLWEWKGEAEFEFAVCSGGLLCCVCVSWGPQKKILLAALTLCH